ncbi:MAG: ABC transporter permease [Alphaproteobacteria bacterium]|nr:ABC transporter permease [Alphaproteobacteria bacterium]
MALCVFLGPVVAGLAGSILPSFGYFPALGGEAFSLAPWRALAAYPGLGAAAWFSFWTGLAATLLSLAAALIFTAAWRGTVWFKAFQRLVSPLLSVPHSAVALGMVFLLAPSGWAMRAVSPSLTGFERPPDLATAPDPFGIVYVACLVVKETPFLFLMILAALNQIPDSPLSASARTMGYRRTIAWLKAVAPLVLRQIRLPVLAVLAYSVSVVDVALILTPVTRPTLGVLVLRWFNDPDLATQFVAAAGACLQIGVVLAAGLVWKLGELGAGRLFRRWIASGDRSRGENGLRVGGFALASLVGVLGGFGLVVAALWSVAQRWRFPDVLPSAWSLRFWDRHAEALLQAAGVTLTVAAVAAALSVLLALACLENEKRRGLKPGNGALWLLYTPLLTPQIAFLFGAQVLLVTIGLDGAWVAVIWFHMLFVGPYVFLSLSGPYRKLDPRYRAAAVTLGATETQAFFRVVLPVLLRPVLVAAAVGVAVSVGQYLPTVFAGAGRFETLTTEAVALSAGGDRRLVAMLALSQSVLPFLGFLAAIMIPAWLYRDRRELSGFR